MAWEESPQLWWSSQRAGRLMRPRCRAEAESEVNLKQTAHKNKQTDKQINKQTPKNPTHELHRLCKLPLQPTVWIWGAVLLWVVLPWKRFQPLGGYSSDTGDKQDSALAGWGIASRMPADGMRIHFQLGGSRQASLVSEARVLQYRISSQR